MLRRRTSGNGDMRRYSQVVTATDSNPLGTYLFLFEGAGSNPAGVALFVSFCSTSALKFTQNLNLQSPDSRGKSLEVVNQYGESLV